MSAPVLAADVLTCGIPRRSRCARVASQSSTSIAKWLDDTMVGCGVTVKWISPLPRRSCSWRWFSAGPRSRNSAPSTFSYHARVRSRSLICTFTWWIILMAMDGPLYPLIRATPVVLEHDLLERPAADGTELPHRIADRQDRVRVNARRQPERRLGFLLVEQVPRCQGGAEPEGSGR